MFAIYDRITAKQLYYQIVMSMVGIFLVFLPGYQSLYGWQGVVCCLGGFVVWFLYGFFLVRISSHYGHLEKVLGRFGKTVYSVWMILFFLFSGAFLTSLIYGVKGTYFEPDAEPPLIHGTILLACTMAGLPQIQRRGRMAEVSFPILAGALILLLALSFGQQAVQEDTFFTYLRQNQPLEAIGIWSGIYILFAVSTGLWGLPFLLHQVKGNRLKSMAGAYGTLLAVLAFVLLLLQGSYGTRQVLMREWPIVSLMGGIRIPGGFVFRIDPVWIGILLLLLLFSVGSTLFYTNYIAKTMQVHWKWFWTPAVVYILSLIPTPWGTVKDYFDELLLFVFCPVIVLFHVIIGVRGMKYRS